MRSYFVRRLLYPSMERLQRRRFLSLFEDYQRLQFKPYPELRARQEEKLSRLLEHARTHVPFYRERFRTLGLKPEDIRGLEDLSKIPPLTREEIRRNFPEGMAADDIPSRGRILDRTSGSTGTPLLFYKDRDARDRALAGFLLFNDWAGVEAGEKSVHIGAPLPLPLMSRFSAVLRGHQDLPVFDLNARNSERILARLKNISPVLLEGYSSAIFQVALAALRLDIRVRPRAVVTTSDTLASLAPVQDAFACPVFNRYGNREMGGALAQNCPSGASLHVNSELCLLEVVDDRGEPVPPGRQGRVVLTDLNNPVMPLIRLDSGDIATAGGACSCGRGFPLVGGIQGRSSEFLVSPDGLMVSPVSLGHFLFVTRPYADEILKVQALQEVAGRVVFRVVPMGPAPGTLKRRLREDLEPFLGRGMDIEVELVEDIPAGPGGKHSIIRSSLTGRLPVPGKPSRSAPQA